MTLDTTMVATFVKGVQRLENSLNGNPQYRIHTTNGTVDTPKDSQLVSILELKEEK